MKIVHIIPSLQIGGAERLVLDVCRELNRQLLDVTLVVLSSKIEFDIKKDRFIKIIPTRVEPHFLRKSSCEISELQNFIISQNPEIVHTHLWESEVVAAHLAFGKATRRFCHFHNPMPQSQGLKFGTLVSKNRLTDYWENRLIQKKIRNASVISVSEVIHRIAITNWPKQNHYYLHNAIYLDRFIKRNRTSKENPFKLLQVGSLVENKNNTIFIDLCALLKKDGIAFEAEIVGDGPLFPLLKKQIDSNNLTTNVKLIGSTEQVEKYYSTADLYIHTALKEAFGLAILEAMAATLPVIAFNAGGNAELIENGKNGYLIQNHDFTELYNRVKEVLQTPNLLESMGENSGKMAQNFSMRQYVEKLLQLYSEAL